MNAFSNQPIAHTSPPRQKSVRGFTLFELLAVLTVISLGLFVLVGAYSSWGTANAITGAARILEAGLEQGRALATTRHAYVAFDYGTVTTNGIQTVSGFQLFLCAPTNDTTSVESVLSVFTRNNDLADIPGNVLCVTPAAPYQRLTGHVRLAYVRETDLQNSTPAKQDRMMLFFRPDGSVWSDPDDTHAHYLCVYTVERFARGNSDSDTLTRYLRIDLATGLATVINPEVTP